MIMGDGIIANTFKFYMIYIHFCNKYNIYFMRSNYILNFEYCFNISMKCQNKLQKDTIATLKQT